MSDHYADREQAIVKHFVLKEYLEALAFKLGSHGSTINYVDGFSGPWLSGDEQLSDTSPHIALSRLTAAREALGSKGRSPKFRCLFIEKDPDAYARLQKLGADFPSIEVQSIHGEFEDEIDRVRQFATTGQDPFAFIFIDPKGWTGYALDDIRPLLTLSRVEVMVNFMTNFVKRFVDTPDPRETFVRLFGTEDYQNTWVGLEGQDREDAIVREYCRTLGIAGNLRHTCSTVVLNPRKDRTHYNLIYATRSIIGLQTFRAVERKALKLQDAVRSDLQQKAREEGGQSELFDSQTLSTRYLHHLAVRYRGQAERELDSLLSAQANHDYDDVAARLMEYPMVAERQVKDWLKARKKSGRIRWILPSGKRAFKLRRGDRIEVLYNGREDRNR
jgi:three-Cys-motif partner protein